MASELFVPYKKYAKILKWLAIVLFAYPITAFVVGQPWGQVLVATFDLTRVQFDFTVIMIMVGLSVRLSPRIFFWDTSEVVEDEITHKRLAKPTSYAENHPAFPSECLGRQCCRYDARRYHGVVYHGLVCATVLNSHGITQIDTAADAARAIEPLVQGFPNAGLVAKPVFSVGILGTGLPDTRPGWKLLVRYSGNLRLERRAEPESQKAKGFYVVIIIATVVGPHQSHRYRSYSKPLCGRRLSTALLRFHFTMIARVGRKRQDHG